MTFREVASSTPDCLSEKQANCRAALETLGALILLRTPFQMARRSVKRFEFDGGKEWGKASRSLARVVIFQDGKDCVSIRRVGRNFEYQSFFVIYDENEEVIDKVKCSREISSIGHAC